MSYRFDDKVCLITGAASGIGRATAIRMASLGAKLALSDINSEGLSETNNLCEGGHLVETFDVSSSDACSSFLTAIISRFSRLDHVFNCAGVNPTAYALTETTDAYWDKLVNTNLKGTYNVTRAAIPHLQAGASMVNVSSTMGIQVAANYAIYCATKFGIVGFTKAMAMELGPLQIRVNGVAPGYIHTPTNAGVVAGPEAVQEQEKKIALGRMGTAAEVADVVAFLFRSFGAIRILGDLACKTCVVRLLVDAFKYEINYLPKWGNFVPHPRQFDHVVPQHLIATYEQREEEYKTPTGKRVYCPCGVFQGSIVKEDIFDTNITPCNSTSCGKLVCLKCRGAYDSPELALSHDCERAIEERKAARAADKSEAFHGLKRGKHWQQCFSKTCCQRIQLSKACNHVTCVCGTSFCFICGNEAQGQSGHWNQGGCPRYRQPGQANARYRANEPERPEDEDDMGWQARFSAQVRSNNDRARRLRQRLIEAERR